MTAGYGGFLYSPDPKDIPEHWHWLIGPTRREADDDGPNDDDTEDRRQSALREE